VVYSGEDARFEYIYKFVSRDRIKPGGARPTAELLDHGTLYVARFDADGKGRWLPLVHGQGPLTAANGFADQGEVVIKTRQASDLLGATKMDRPEWLAIDPQRLSLLHADQQQQPRRSNQPGVDAANPRANNVMGQIIRWKEDGDFDGASFAGTTWCWPATRPTRAEAKGNIKGDASPAPTACAFDRGRAVDPDRHVHVGHGQGRAGEHRQQPDAGLRPATGEIRRFLTGPVGCEITGATFTPDGRTMFINVQHPGETRPSAATRPSRGAFPTGPTSARRGRPRSATVVIRKADGGVIGT
jgi:secreted PhoX family phosphatase